MTNPAPSNAHQAAQSPNPQLAKPPYIAIVDEMGYYFGRNDDDLREKLREIEGIPNHAYKVQGDKVFVFDKLVKLVRNSHPGKDAQGQEPDLTSLALKLLPDAFVSPQEAVEDWSVVPFGYELVQQRKSAPVIRHRSLQAAIPGEIRDDAYAKQVLQTLLMGKVHAGEGDFLFKGQPMRLLQSFDPSDLPARPSQVEGLSMPSLDQVSRTYSALGDAEFEPGLDVVSRASFDELRELELSWRAIQKSEHKNLMQHISILWGMTDDLMLDTLNDPADSFHESEQDNARKLRELYPELGMMSMATIWSHFDSYQLRSHRLRSWDASRQEEFLPYLIGAKIDSSLDEDRGLNAGLWAGVALLKGASLEESMTYGRQAQAYSEALFQMAYRVKSAMLFLQEDKQREPGTGNAISTMGDMLRMGRKMSINPVKIEQSAEDFGVTGSLAKALKSPKP